MSVLCNDFAWFRRIDRVFRKNPNFGFAKFLKCSRQDKNQAHLNISMQVKLMFLILL